MSKSALTKAPDYIRIKIISAGDSQVGKSCLIKRYCEERFVEKYITTIGIDFGVRPMLVDGQSVKVNFWDLAGNDQYLEIRNEFYRDTQGGILVYDASSRESFLHLDKWLRECIDYGGSDVTFCVCANKEGRSWAEKHGFRFFETSAKTNKNVSEVFQCLFSSVTQSVLRNRK